MNQRFRSPFHKFLIYENARDKLSTLFINQEKEEEELEEEGLEEEEEAELPEEEW